MDLWYERRPAGEVHDVCGEGLEVVVDVIVKRISVSAPQLIDKVAQSAVFLQAFGPRYGLLDLWYGIHDSCRVIEARPPFVKVCVIVLNISARAPSVFFSTVPPTELLLLLLLYFAQNEGCRKILAISKVAVSDAIRSSTSSRVSPVR